MHLRLYRHKASGEIVAELGKARDKSAGPEVSLVVYADAKGKMVAIKPRMLREAFAPVEDEGLRHAFATLLHELMTSAR